MEIKEYPNGVDEKEKVVKFGMRKDKFMQFNKDMKEALALMEAVHSME